MSEIDAAKRAASRRLRQTAAAFVLVVAGLALALCSWPGPSEASVARYIYGNGSPVPTVVDQVRTAFSADVLFVIGYTAALGGCAWIFLLWAISAAGRLAAIYAVAAVGIAFAAGLFEDSLLCCAVHGQHSTIWITIIAAAATVKWCALLLALVGIPATLGILLRAIAAGWRYLRARLSDKTNTKWWDEVVVASPNPTVNADKSTWVNAYNVPDAEEVIAARDGERVQAICLSGGGVRSACIAMGVMQEFSKEPPFRPGKNVEGQFGGKAKLIDTVDYVISVSGGGYAAGARLLAVQPQPTVSDAPAETGSEPAPEPVALPEKPLVSERFEEGSPEFDHFRRGSSYIADSPGELIYALAVVFKNLLASITILFTLPALLGWVFGYLLSRPAFSFAESIPVRNPDVDDAFMRAHPDYLLCLTNHSASWWAVAFFAALAALLTSLAMLVELLLWGKRSEVLKLWLQRFALGSAVFALLVLTVVAGLPTLMRLCSTLSLHATHNQGDAATAVSGLVGLNYVAAIAAMAWKKRTTFSGEATKLSWWKRVLPPGVIALVLVVVTLAVLLVAWLIILGCFAAGVFRSLTLAGIEGGLHQIPFSAWWPSAVLAAATVWISSVDVASVSLNPFYRYRLGRTFAVRRVQLPSGRWRAETYDRNEFTWLQEFGRVPAGGPKFVFAAAATISGADKPAPGLNAVSYVLSHDYIGGPDLGWLRTPELDQEAPPRIKRDLTVLTAVAASGAAFASAMGRNQKGFEKLLAVSGARLGTWLPNPNFVANLAGAEKGTCIDPKDNTRPWPKSLPYIRGAGYYYRELIGLNYPDARLVQVTDGGHYENLGLVEALRRRSRLIFCIDGGGDTPPLASGLADALRLAQYELGVTIAFGHYADYPLDELTPGSGEEFEKENAFSSLNNRLAKRTVAAGLITYPAASGLSNNQNGHQGVLIFAKAVLCRELPQWLLTYAAANDVFPHDPTSDQWFNEGQFAAYTQLGRIMGQQVLKCVKDLKDLTPPPAP
jgi:hypothetical protein